MCRYDKAIEYLSEKLRLVRELNDVYGITSTLGYLGLAYQRNGDYDKSMELYKLCLVNLEELGDRRKILITVGNMGLHYADVGDFRNAIECYERNMKIASEMGDTQILSITLGNLGLVHKAMGDNEQALAYFDRAIEGHSKMRYLYGLVHWLFGKAEVLFSLGKYEEAKKYTAESMRISKELKKSDLFFHGQVLMARIDFSLSMDDRYVTQLENLLNGTKEKEERATLFYALSLMNTELKRNEAANKYKEKALAQFRELYAKTPRHNYKVRIEELA
jgi:tetratricopeptide (TPR) repeat protein